MSTTPSLKTVALSSWLEGIAYGFFACTYGWTIVTYHGQSHSRIQSAQKLGFSVMLGFSTVMFCLATVHIAIVGYHLILQVATQLSGPMELPQEIVLRSGVGTWWIVTYTTIYVTQELLGGAAAIYRCWLLWNRDWRVMIVPGLLILSAIGIGYIPTVLFYVLPPLQLFSDQRIPIFMTTFYILTVVMNIISTTLLVYPIWSTHRLPKPNSRLALQIQDETNSVLPCVMRIVIESAVLQLVVEAVLLVSFLAESEAQFVLLGLVVPIVGITFTLITLRIKSVVSNLRVCSGPVSGPRDIEEHPARRSGSFIMPGRVCGPKRKVLAVSDQQSILITEDLNLEHDTFDFQKGWESTTRWSV